MIVSLTKSRGLKLSLLCLMIFLTNCQALLDKEPQNKISLEETFQDIESATVALSGAYRSLFDLSYLNGNRLLYPDVAGGNIKHATLSNARLLDVYNLAADPGNEDTETSSSSGGMNSTYSQLYSILNNLNNIITKVPAITNGTARTRTRLVAEATALRAMIHFDLVLLYAQPYTYTSDASHPGIILNLKPILVSESQRPRQTVAECYEAIIEDLNQSLVLFENSTAIWSSGSTKNYMNPSVVQALLARVYLNQGDWQQAYTYANTVITSNAFSLYTNQNYVSSWTQKNTSEAIFEVSVPSNYNTTSLGSFFDVTSAGASNNFLQMAATNDLLDLYEATDVRNKSSLYTTTTLANTVYSFCNKYNRGNENSTGIKVIRLSEMYLIRAEAAAHLNNFTQAYQDLNTIRQRADPSATALSGTNQQELLNLIYLERRKELCFEGFLMLDLARTKQNLNRQDCQGIRCSLTYPSDYFILPLPAKTVLVNPFMAQNPGY
ncbi:RagB/SusD family nutrient uptake outer membrane protein [Siphonobacter sp. SORGH_AS_0500]|uniref:RagB/SusD family nutrient uptake outer membrane protein n=1 Tax=Siphonobacter sp. SORGH_AS_0500 TaxID=1864824 RepID=UPI002857F51A|nr:RagB/SusD family nutrient uptake outer membrane protein [Siphonobacter sp. SORGH_AS_0500]MDR6197476.1 hypothetical protein [Siphonobacter sp. SORGH_AS_0500]